MRKYFPEPLQGHAAPRYGTALLRPLLLFSLLSVATVATAVAQEVEAIVAVNSERLPIKLREEVAGFAAEFERYVNETRWVGDKWQGAPIQVNITVAFTQGNEEGDFRASIAIVSQRDIYLSDRYSPTMRIIDEDWTFKYVRNQQFRQDQVGYDQITGLIDFYVYIALGLDLDTYGYLGGKDQYERALQIARQGELAVNSEGWSVDEPTGSFSRQNFIRELTNIRFYPLRKFLLDYHYNGLDKRAEYPQRALDSIAVYVTELVKIKDNLVSSSTLVRVINDTKHLEFAEIFTGYKDKSIWEKLLYLDPTHQSVYEEARNKR